MEQFRDESNLMYYNDIIYDWLEDIRKLCEDSASNILQCERTHEAPSIYPALIEVLNSHMTIREEYVEIDETDQVEDEDMSELEYNNLKDW